LKDIHIDCNKKKGKDPSASHKTDPSRPNPLSLIEAFPIPAIDLSDDAKSKGSDILKAELL
jgi:hypothetical protein